MTKNIIRFISLMFFIITFNLTSEAQVFKAYVAGGINLSQVDGDQAFGYKKVGANVGVGVDMNIFRFMSASLEANFNQKGARQKPFPELQGQERNGAYKININYVEIPLIIHFTDNTGIFKIGAGVSYGRMVNAAREECHRTDHSNYIIYNKTDEMMTYADFVPNIEANKNFEYYEIVKEWNEGHGKLNPNDWNVIGSLQVKIWQRLKVEFRIAYSLRKLRTSDYYRGADDKIPDGIKPYWDGEWKAFQRKEYNNSLSFRVIYVINENQAERNKSLIKSRGGDI